MSRGTGRPGLTRPAERRLISRADGWMMATAGKADRVSDVAVRPARPEDVAEVVAMIRELAAYERVPEAAQATDRLLHASLFGPDARVFCHIAEQDGQTVGFALWFVNFSTWLGRHGIYLEDLYVRPTARGRGAGRGLVGALAQICVNRGYRRLDWTVLDWNEPARQFYDGLGARALPEWVPYRLCDDALRRVATSGE